MTTLAGQDPRSALAALHAAVAAAARGEAFAALDLVRSAVAAPEPLREEWAKGVMCCSQLGDEDGALLAARRLWQETPASPQTAFILARTLEETGRIGEAIAILLPFAQAGKLSLAELMRLVRLLMFAGQIDQAQALARRLLQRDPHNPSVWELLAQAKRFTPDDPDLVALAALQRRLAEAPTAERARAAWAWGKAQVDLGDDESAEKALGTAAALRRQLAVLDMDSLELATEASLDAVAAPEFEAASGGLAGERVIFIIGPQRSGTTLVDQILCSHPAIAGGGELPFLPLMRHALGDFTAQPVAAYLQRQRAAGAADPWAAVRDRYFALGDERFGPGSRFTDKLLSNHFRLAVIRCAFPRAPVICLRRDPLEVAWSCWRANFNLHSAWNASPEWLARYLASYERVVNYWATRFPGWILEVDYARLVSAPEQEIPRMLAHCGLPDDPATRSPHLAQRSVSTSSFAQVRQPIHAGRMGAAQSFPRATAGLRRALQAAGLDFAP